MKVNITAYKMRDAYRPAICCKTCAWSFYDAETTGIACKEYRGVCADWTVCDRYVPEEDIEKYSATMEDYKVTMEARR
jgi:hypothetical protein